GLARSLRWRRRGDGHLLGDAGGLRRRAWPAAQLHGGRAAAAAAYPAGDRRAADGANDPSGYAGRAERGETAGKPPGLPGPERPRMEGAGHSGRTRADSQGCEVQGRAQLPARGRSGGRRARGPLWIGRRDVARARPRRVRAEEDGGRALVRRQAVGDLVLRGSEDQGGRAERRGAKEPADLGGSEQEQGSARSVVAAAGPKGARGVPLLPRDAGHLHARRSEEGDGRARIEARGAAGRARDRTAVADRGETGGGRADHRDAASRGVRVGGAARAAAARRGAGAYGERLRALPRAQARSPPRRSK